MMRSALIAALAASAGLAPAFGQEAAPADDRIVVQGTRDLGDTASELVDGVEAQAIGRGHARWDQGVCIMVGNLPEAQAQYVIDRITAISLEAGLEPKGPGCEPQLIITFTTDGAGAAQNMVAAAEGNTASLFRTEFDGLNLGESALQDFMYSDRAVRWWATSIPIAPNGRPMFDPRTGRAFPPSPYDPPSPSAGTDGKGRLTDGLRDFLQKVVVIVDVAALEDVNWDQLADYLAMVGLAQVHPSVEIANDSILNLFSNHAPGLSIWDRSYLIGLYWSDPTVAVHLADANLEHGIKRAYRRLMRESE